MTLISVGSTGTPGASNAGSGASPSDDTAPSGFDTLLAGAHPPHEPIKGPVRESSSAATDQQPCDSADANAPTTASQDSGGTEKTDGSTKNPTNDSTSKPAADMSGLLAVLGALAWTPPTTTPPPAPADGTATGESTPAATSTSTVLDPSALPDATTAASSTAVIDLAAVLANLPAESSAPAPQPVLLPLPNLPAATPPHAREDAQTANTAPASTPSTPNITTALPPDHPRAEPAPPPLSTGAATFAAAGPAPTSTAAMTNANTDTGTTTAATVAPPPPSEQLVSVLTPLRTTTSGTYTLRLELKPPELGRVEMRVEMRDGVLHASIHAEHQSSAQQLRDALGDLRERLGAEGVRTGDLTVSDASVGSRQHESGRAPASPDAPLATPSNDELPPDVAPTVSPTLDSEATSLLDVRV